MMLTDDFTVCILLTRDLILKPAPIVYIEQRADSEYGDEPSQASQCREYGLRVLLGDGRDGFLHAKRDSHIQVFHLRLVHVLRGSPADEVQVPEMLARLSPVRQENGFVL